MSRSPAAPPHDQHQSSSQAIGERVRQAREALGLTQREVAEAVDLPAAQTLSEIEHGRREVRPAELVRIARFLHTSVDILLGIEQPPAAAGVLWRRTTQGANRRREAQLQERAERYAQLERWCGEEPPKTLKQYSFDFANQTPEGAAELADEVRKSMDLGSIPSATLLRTLEETYGVKVFWDYLTQESDGDCSAACTRGEFGCAILLDASEPAWRRNFSLAHELFHLLTWEVSIGFAEDNGPRHLSDRVETYADRFAGALLLPEESISERFRARARDGRITYGELVRMARDFGVSTTALLIRLRELQHISSAIVDRLLSDRKFREVDEKSWPAPEHLSVPFSPRYVKLAYAAFQQGTIGVSMLAKYLEKPIADLELPETIEDAAEAAIPPV